MSLVSAAYWDGCIILLSVSPLVSGCWCSAVNAHAFGEKIHFLAAFSNSILHVACFQSACSIVTTHKARGIAEAPSPIWMQHKQSKINRTSEKHPTPPFGGWLQGAGTSAPYVRWCSHLARVLIVSGVWARTNSCSQPLPDVPDRPSVWLFVRRGVIFDPSCCSVIMRRAWEAPRGATEAQQPHRRACGSLWWIQALVKWLQLWKNKALWKPPTAGIVIEVNTYDLQLHRDQRENCVTPVCLCTKRNFK